MLFLVGAINKPTAWSSSVGFALSSEPKLRGYQKCGVQLSAIQRVTAPDQADLFDFAEDDTQSDNRQLMAAVDQINRRFPKAVSIAATGIDRSWKPKAERKSQRYTTDWGELVRVG